MHLDKINLALEYLDKGNNIAARAILIEERNRQLDLNEHFNNSLVQEAFELYVSEIAFPNSSKRTNLYFYDGSLFTFTNGKSIYQLNRKLEITEKTENDFARKSMGLQLLREAKAIEIHNLVSHCQALLGNKKLVQSESNSSEKTMYEWKNIRYSFARKEIEYMDIFLGKNAKVYISDENPIAYAESEMGTGYVLGLGKTE